MTLSLIQYALSKSIMDFWAFLQKYIKLVEYSDCLIHCFCFIADVIMDMLNNSKMREAILQYYQQSGDPRLVFEAIKQSQEEDNEMIDGNNDIVYTIFGKRR